MTIYRVIMKVKKHFKFDVKAQYKIEQNVYMYVYYTNIYKCIYMWARQTLSSEIPIK